MQYFGEPVGRVNIQLMSKNLQRYLYTLRCLIRDLEVFYLSRSRGNELSTNIVWYLYSFRVLFVFYEAVLDNNTYYWDSDCLLEGLKSKHSC